MSREATWKLACVNSATKKFRFSQISSLPRVLRAVWAKLSISLNHLPKEGLSFSLHPPSTSRAHGGPYRLSLTTDVHLNPTEIDPAISTPNKARTFVLLRRRQRVCLISNRWNQIDTDTLSTRICAGGVFCFPIISPALVAHLKLTQPQLTTIALAYAPFLHHSFSLVYLIHA